MKIKISELCDNLNNELYSELQIIESNQFSTEHIKKIALEKLEKHRLTLDENTLKGTAQDNKEDSIATFKISGYKLTFGNRLRQLLIAAIIVSLSCATVFALNNEAFFKYLFGENISPIQSSIETSNETVSDKNFKLQLESTLLYGNVNYFIVSLERLDGSEFSDSEKPDFSIRGNFGTGIFRKKEIQNDDSTAVKKYYALEMACSKIPTDGSLSIVFEGMYGENTGHNTIDSHLSIAVKNIDDNKSKTIDIAKPEKECKYYFTKVVISPVGLMITGKANNNQKNAIPVAKVKIIYKNGTSERISYRTEEKIQASFGHDSVENTFRNQYKFNKLRDVGKIKSIEIDGQEYLLK